MGRIPDDTIDLIRDRVDVVGLVGRFVNLKKAGRSYKGLCPFHTEKTPSFHVNPDRQSFHCFGCQEGGNVFTFLMKMENLTFPEAARVLAREVGIDIPETAASGEQGLSEKVCQLTELAQGHYRASLAGSTGATYLSERGIDAATIDHFGIGYAPDRWDSLVQALRSQKLPSALAERAGLLAERSSGGHYDRLRDRVTFPIQDVRGRVIGFGGRAITAGQEPKYLNTPESPVFKKREAFFGFPASLEPIRRKQRAVVVEGYFDLVALWRAGVEECVATCGTALTAEHARNLCRRTETVVLMFDGDEAGQKAALRSLEVLLPEGLRVRAAVLPAGEDPDDFLTREGAEALQKLVDEAPPALEIAIRRAVSSGVASPWEKADAVAVVAPLLSLVKSAVERSELCTQLALAVGTEVRHVEAAVRSAGRGEDPRESIPVAPRRHGPEQRKLLSVARCLSAYPALGTDVSQDLLGLAPPGPLLDVIFSLIKDSEGGRRSDVEELASGLDDEARSQLYAVFADEQEIEEGVAKQVLADTLVWLRTQWSRERQKELTRRMREPGADVDALMREKVRLQELARSGVVDSPVTAMDSTL